MYYVYVKYIVQDNVRKRNSRSFGFFVTLRNSISYAVMYSRHTYGAHFMELWKYILILLVAENKIETQRKITIYLNWER